MMLTKEAKDQYDRDGYLVLRQVFDRADLEPVRQSIADYVDAQIRQLQAAGKITNPHDDAPFETRWELVTRENGLQKDKAVIRSWGGAHGLLSPAIYNLYIDPRLTDIMASILGPEVSAHGDYWIRPKLPGDPSTTLAWHQDSFYYLGPADSDSMAAGKAPQKTILTAWMPLVDVDDWNGCLKLARGSHRHGLIAARKNAQGQWEPAEAVTRYGTVSSEPMQVGDALIFNNLTLHASGNNSADHVRWNIDLRYSTNDQSYDWHSLGERFDAYYPGFVARSADPSRVTSYEQWKSRWEARPR